MLDCRVGHYLVLIVQEAHKDLLAAVAVAVLAHLTDEVKAVLVGQVEVFEVDILLDLVIEEKQAANGKGDVAGVNGRGGLRRIGMSVVCCKGLRHAQQAEGHTHQLLQRRQKRGLGIQAKEVSVMGATSITLASLFLTKARACRQSSTYAKPRRSILRLSCKSRPAGLLVEGAGAGAGAGTSTAALLPSC